MPNPFGISDVAIFAACVRIVLQDAVIFHGPAAFWGVLQNANHADDHTVRVQSYKCVMVDDAMATRRHMVSGTCGTATCSRHARLSSEILRQPIPSAIERTPLPRLSLKRHAVLSSLVSSRTSGSLSSPSSMSRIRPARAAGIAGAVVPVNLSSIASAGAGSSGRICSRFCSFCPFFILTITSPVRNFGKPESASIS